MTSLLYDIERYLELFGHLKAWALASHTCKTAQSHAMCSSTYRQRVSTLTSACRQPMAYSASCGFASSRRERSSPVFIVYFQSCKMQIFFQGAEVAHYPLQSQAQRQVVLRLCSTQHDMKKRSKRMPNASYFTYLPFNLPYSTFYCWQRRRGTCRHSFHTSSWLSVRDHRKCDMCAGEHKSHRHRRIPVTAGRLLEHSTKDIISG